MLDESLVNEIKEINKQKVAQYREIINDIQQIYELTGIQFQIKVDRIKEVYTQIRFIFENNVIWIHIDRRDMGSKAFKSEDNNMELVSLFIKNKDQIRKELNFILSNYLQGGQPNNGS